MTSIPIGMVKAGNVETVPYTAASLADAALKEPQGVYTAGRTYQHDKVLLFDEHLDRLERSARLEGINVTVDRPAVRSALKQLVDQSGYDDARFRITLPREAPDQPIITLEPFIPVSTEIIQNGARVVTVHLSRHNPVAKTTEWMTRRRAATDSFPPDIYEGILVAEDGSLLEGTNSNFYGIRGGTLYTADNNRVLPGIARRILLTVAPDVLPVQMTAITVDEIGSLDEAFLTSASRGVIPIVEIDGKLVGNGKPGPSTLRLRDQYEAWANAQLKPLV